MENIFLFSILILLSVILIGFVFKNRNAGQFKLRTIFYILVFSLFIGIGGIWGSKDIFKITNSILYFVLIVWMLALGIVHVSLLKKILPWITDKIIWTGLSLTLSIGFLGSAFLLLIFHFIKFSDLVKINLISVLFFAVPFLFYITLVYYMEIPVKILRKWQYPVDKHIDDPTDREMDSPLVVGFEFKKKASDENMTTFRAKAPKEMVFGKLFYYFINDYNDRNPDEKIEFIDENNKPFHWIFFHKPGWFGNIRYIDPGETNSFNFIRENSVIICKRVIES